MKEKKTYHQRKLAIIEMIEECDRCIVNAKHFHESIKFNNSVVKEWSLSNSKKNMNRYERIKQRLNKWLGE